MRSKEVEFTDVITGSKAFPVERAVRCAIRTVGESPVHVRHISAETGEETILCFLQSGTAKANVNVPGPGEVTFSTPGKKEFALTLRAHARQTQEPHHLKPPPAKEPPPNILAAMRRKVQEEFGLRREDFLQSTMPNYEIDDDDPGMFEEELAKLKADAPPPPPSPDPSPDPAPDPDPPPGPGEEPAPTP